MEELCKALVVVLIVQEVNSRYDGLIYGVTAGMGFAMMENLTYSIGALAAGSGWGIVTLIRGLASTIGHGVTAGLIGYAVGAYINPDRRTGFGTVALAYLGAVGLHAGWNGLLTAATGLSAGAGLVAMACIIGIWPFMEIGLLVWLMDLGLVDQIRPVEEGLLRGTPATVAPETLRGGAVDGLADGWADGPPTSEGSVVGRLPELGPSGRSPGGTTTTGGYGA